MCKITNQIITINFFWFSINFDILYKIFLFIFFSSGGNSFEQRVRAAGGNGDTVGSKKKKHGGGHGRGQTR